MLRGKKIVLTAVMLATLTVVGACRNTSSSNNPTATCTDSVSCRSSGTTSITGGANVVLNIVSTSVFNSYAGRPVTPTTSIQLNLNVTSNGGVYLGESNIFYYEGSTYRQGHFTNGTDSGNGNNVHILTTEQGTGIPTYRFFFEDPAGDIIITLQQDGGLPTDTNYGTLSGSVYFKNFNTTAPNPLYQSYTDQLGYYWPANPLAFCWSGKISVGPYNCQNTTVQPTSSGSGGVTKLGTFTGMDKKTAFNM